MKRAAFFGGVIYLMAAMTKLLKRIDKSGICAQNRLVVTRDMKPPI
jgi:hypothetical protein